MHGSISALAEDVKSRIMGAVMFGDSRNAQDKGRIPNFPPERARWRSPTKEATIKARGAFCLALPCPSLWPACAVHVVGKSHSMCRQTLVGSLVNLPSVGPLVNSPLLSVRLMMALCRPWQSPLPLSVCVWDHPLVPKRACTACQMRHCVTCGSGPTRVTLA
jgi:hypothetical protein